MSGLASKVDVKNMMKGDEKDTTGKKDNKKEKAIAKGLKVNDADTQNKNDKKIDKPEELSKKETKKSTNNEKKKVDIDLNNIKQLSDLLEDYNFLNGDKISAIDVEFIKK